MSSPQSPTPFDDLNNTGANVPDAKYTQPLPPPFQNNLNRRAGSLLNGLQSGAPAPANDDVVFPPPPSAAVLPTSVPPTYAPPAAPAPVVRPVAASSSLPAMAASPTTRLKLLPTPTLIGLAVAAGALVVVLVPALMRRVIPTVPMKTLPTTTVPQPRAASPSAALPTAPLPDTAPDKPLSSKAVAPSTSASTADAPADTPGLSAADDEPLDDKPPGDKSVASAPQDQTSDSQDSDVREVPSREVPASEAPALDPPSDDQEAEFAASAGSGKRERRAAKSESRGAGRARQSVRSARAGYDIEPPSNWKLRQSGRRTIWQGPHGAQLLVETSDDIGSSPRRDWEQLDKALARKYGARYRSLGIRETMLAGLPAAAWEFELQSKGGTATRKLDIAVHHRGRGYAVLGSAPAERFEELKPQLQSAIDSFRLRGEPADQDEKTAPPARDAEKSRDEDATSSGY